MDDIKLTDKNVIITGANCGIGYETALDLAKRGANVILACRSEQKAQDACDKIKNESKNDKIEIELLDLGSFKSIKEFSERIKAKLTHLDILVNNAGLFNNDYKKSPEGFESHFGINYLGPYYLTRLLLDLIKNTENSRIINVSSEAYKGGKMNWDDLQCEKSYGAFKAYSDSKLGNVLFTIELSRRLEETTVSTVSLHPGFVKTEIFGREVESWYSSFMQKFVGVVAFLFAKNQNDGAKTTIHCAVSHKIPEESGSYYDNCKVAQLKPHATNLEDACRLWNLSAELVGLDKD